VSGQVRLTKEGVWKGGGWLDWLLAALDAQDDLANGEVQHDWGSVRIQVMTEMPGTLDLGSPQAVPAWSAVQSAALFEPPLLATVPVDHTAAARHLSVTQIADLGAWEFGPYYGDRFRRQVLQATPAHVGAVDYQPGLGRLIGEMVHEALRWWRPDQDPQTLDRLLESFAWQHGIVDAEEQTRIMGRARRMLEDFYRSDVFAWLKSASEVYRELPFIWNNGERIIHGVVDTLLRRADGTWVIVDYKTSALPEPTQAQAADHARRFYMQVGAYAEAVQRQLAHTQMVDDGPLAVYIHYIRYGLTVEVQPADWQAALDKMEPYIGRLTGDV
jgi:hypothetical protein